MQLPRDHHYSPKFLLRRWTVNGGPLCEMRLVRGKVLPSHRFPAGTGKARDLYRTENVPEAYSQDVELHFMSPMDNRGAASLDKFLSGRPLSDEDRHVWAQFLLSLLFRTPEGVTQLKRHVAEMWAYAAELQVAWSANRGPLDLTFEEDARRSAGGFDIRASNMLMDVIERSPWTRAIARMRWSHIELANSKLSLLTSDRPLMTAGLKTRECRIVLPIGPRDLFMAAYDDCRPAISAQEETRGVKLFNKRVVSQARQYVWGLDASQLQFVRKHMATSPDRAMLTDAEWQELNAHARGCLAESTAIATSMKDAGVS